VYEDLHLPCDGCKTRGFECGEKLWGPVKENRSGRLVQVGNSTSTSNLVTIPRPLAVKDEELTERDFQLLQWSHSSNRVASTDVSIFEPLRSIRMVGLNDNINEPLGELRPPSLSFGSKTFKFAYLAYLSGLRGHPNNDAFYYLDKFHHYVKGAFKDNSFVEIMVASYYLFLYASSLQDFEDYASRDMFQYFRGIWEALGAHSQKANTEGPTRNRSCSAHCSFCVREPYFRTIRLLSVVWYSKKLEDHEGSDFIDRFYDALDAALTYSGSFSRCRNKAMNELCLDFYLRMTTKQSPYARKARALFQKSLQQTIDWGQESGTVDHFYASSKTNSNINSFPPGGSYPSGAICFQMAHLLCKILEPKTDERRNQLTWNAKELRHLLSYTDGGLVRHTYQAIHSLLWVGLILRYPFAILGILVLHRRINVIENDWVFAAIQELKYLMIAKYPKSEVQIEETFQLVIKLLQKANTWSEMECVGNKLDDPDIFECNRMVLKLRFIAA
jgi:hypothetical protein